MILAYGVIYNMKNHKYLFELNTIAHSHIMSIEVECDSLDHARILAYNSLITNGYMKNVYAYYQLELITIDGKVQRK